MDSQTARRLRASTANGRRAPYRSAEAPYRPLGPRYRATGPRPDRVAAWAIVLGVIMVLLAGATSRADVTGGATIPDIPPKVTGGSAQSPDGELAARAARAPAQVATWYGPGFFGRRTACGQVLRRATQGIAHRRLPCGTRVSIYYRGRLKTVTVIDRGPYGHGADWDLTQATARDLGIRHTSRIRVLR